MTHEIAFCSRQGFNGPGLSPRRIGVGSESTLFLSPEEEERANFAMFCFSHYKMIAVK